MNLTCDVRLEYTATGRSGHRWRESAELSILKDDWNHSILVIGGGSKKTSFQVRWPPQHWHHDRRFLFSAWLGFLPFFEAFRLYYLSKWTISIAASDFSSEESNLEKNIKQIHTSFLSDGKLTISLVGPIVNIYIRKAVEENLKTFLRLLQHVQKHPNDDLEEVAERWGILKKPVEVESSSESSSDDEEE